MPNYIISVNSSSIARYELSRGKTNNAVPEQIRHKPTHTSTEKSQSLKFLIQVEEELYYPSSENKGTDQPRSYCEADLRPCSRPCRLLAFPRGGSYITEIYQTLVCRNTGYITSPDISYTEAIAANIRSDFCFH